MDQLDILLGQSSVNTNTTNATRRILESSSSTDNNLEMKNQNMELIYNLNKKSGNLISKMLKTDSEGMQFNG